VRPIWILSVLEHCCNPLCQLYDPVSAISFMRECITEPMNLGPLLIIRNNFPTTLSFFSFLVLIKFENTKILLFTTLANQKTTPPSFTVYHCIAYSRGIRLFWHRCHCIFTYSHSIFHFNFVYLQTPCAWQPLGEVEGTKQIYFILQVARRRIGR
jgi:hypothetical protein